MIEMFNFKKHLPVLSSWLAHYKLPMPDSRQFSATGWVVNKIAIGFLFETNSAQCYMDHVIADPEATPDDRDCALKVLFRKIESAAKENGNVMLIALANLPAMRKRFDSAGYKKHGEYGLYYKSPLTLGGN